MSNENANTIAPLLTEVERARMQAMEADDKAEAGVEGLERQGNEHPLVEEVARLIVDDADAETPEQESVETRPAADADLPDVRQLFEFDSPSAYEIPSSGTKPKVMVRDDSGDIPSLRYGTIQDLAKSVLEEYTEGDGIEIDVEEKKISATPYTAGDGIDITDFVISATGGGLPEGGEEYQVLQRNADGDAVWDWVHYVVPS
jgi:hypothetical protein